MSQLQKDIREAQFIRSTSTRYEAEIAIQFRRKELINETPEVIYSKKGHADENACLCACVII